MDIRILHHHAPGFGWSFDSPDIPGLIGGTDDYDPTEAERAARFALESDAEEAGDSVPATVRFEHFVPAGAAAA